MALDDAFHEIDPRANRGLWRYRGPKRRVRDELRDLLRAEGQDVAPLNRVFPDRVPGLPSTPGQGRQARLRNHVVDAMEQGEAVEVAQAYLCCRAACRVACRAQRRGRAAQVGASATAWSLAKVVAPVVGVALGTAGFFVPPAVTGVGAPIIAILYRNHARGRKTLAGAEDWLRARLGEGGLLELQGLDVDASQEDIVAVVNRHLP